MEAPAASDDGGDQAAAFVPHGHDLRHHGERNLFGAAATEIEADGGVEAPHLVLGEAGLEQAAPAFLLRGLAAEGPDVEGGAGEGGAQGGVVELGVVGEDGDGGPRGEADLAERLVGPRRDHPVGLREARRIGEGRARIDDDRPIAERPGEPHERDRDVDAADDHERGRGADEVDEELELAGGLASPAPSFEGRPGRGPHLVGRRPGGHAPVGEDEARAE